VSERALPDNLAPLSDALIAQIEPLAAIIREVDPGHNLGAAALAWHLLHRGVTLRPPVREDGCACDPTPPSQWTTHAGATEPGSAIEYSPACPIHSQHVFNPLSGVWEFADPDVQAAWETAQAAAMLAAGAGAGLADGTEWAEVPF